MFGIYDTYNKEFKSHCECIYNTKLADLTSDEEWLNENYHVFVKFAFNTVEEAEDELQWHPDFCEVRELPSNYVEIELY